MMFFQYAITGSWFFVVPIYLTQRLGFTGEQVGYVYAAFAIASILSPLVFGQIADRWFPTQYVLAGVYLISTGMLYWLTQLTTFTSFYLLIQIYALFLVPSFSLTNSLLFHQVLDAGKHFPGIRVWGTMGWIVVGLFVGATLDYTTAQPLLMASVLSAIMGIYCLTLPHTPPTHEEGSILPFIKSLGMLRKGTFTLFILVSFILSAAMTSYFAFAGKFLKSIGIEEMAPVASIMTLGPCTEIVLLPLLPLLLKHFGMKRTLTMAIAIWGLRYALLCLGQPLVFVVVGIVLQGEIFIIIGNVFVDNEASKDMRASAQALFQLVSGGLGMLAGNLLFGRLFDYFSRDGTTSWPSFWAFPTMAVAVSLAIFVSGFRQRKTTT